MTEPNWRSPKNYTIPAKPHDGLWTKILDFVAGPRKLRFTATGDWDYATGKTCKPGGALAAIANSFIPTTPIGALICKIGGSSSDGPPNPQPGGVVTTTGGPLVFTVGNFCTIDIADTTKGALFATMNDQLAGFELHDKEITLTVEEAL